MKIEYKIKEYSSDLTDTQWKNTEEFSPSENKRKYYKHSLLEAVLYK